MSKTEAAKSSMPRHTETPWKQDKWSAIKTPDGETLLVVGVAMPSGTHPKADEAEANTAFIVRAVNSHDALLAACKSLMEMLGDYIVCGAISPRQRSENYKTMNEARAAIALAEAGE